VPRWSLGASRFPVCEEKDSCLGLFLLSCNLTSARPSLVTGARCARHWLSVSHVRLAALIIRRLPSGVEY